MATIRLFKHYVRTPFLLLGLVESLIFMVAVYASVYVRFLGVSGGTREHIDAVLMRALMIAVVMVLCMMAMGLYQADLREGFIGFFRRLMVSFLLGIVVFTLIFYLFPILFFGRGVLALTMLFSMGGITVLRVIFYRVARDIFRRRILVLGTGKKASLISELQLKNKYPDICIVGFIHVRGEKDVVGTDQILHIESSLVNFAIENIIDEIVVAVDDRRKDFILHELLDCRVKGIVVVDPLTFFEREMAKVRLDLLEPGWLIFSDGFQRGTLRDFNKRSFDITASLILFFLTWPIMVIVVLAIFIESGWKYPVLYRQIRIGEEGRPFQVLKFRSMCVDAEQDGRPRWANEKDSRITIVGRLIRKLRIDELPQISNILWGDMSFVGPRPERPEFVVTFCDTIQYYTERHHVKPGLTGWAQLKYPYGASVQDTIEKLQYDLYYVKNHSLLLDIGILLQTVAVVLFGKGAR